MPVLGTGDSGFESRRSDMKSFQKTIENFTCENCGERVNGNGYTNHCPRCLYSKHVDINPGDRAEKCHGLMRPIGLKTSGGEHTLIHECIKCSKLQNCKISDKDNFDKIIEISKGAVNN